MDEQERASTAIAGRVRRVAAPAAAGPPDALAPLSENERHVLDVVRRSGVLSRATITGRTRLTQQSVHRIVEGLVQRGLLRAGAALPAGRGQPSPTIELVPDAVFSIGACVNTDSVEIYLADFTCAIVARETLGQEPQDREATLACMAERIDALLRERGIGASRVAGLGLGISGFFVGSGSSVNAPEPLRDWSLVDLGPVLARHFSCPVMVENNATTGAIGESLRGAGLRYDSFAYLSFNYGFGGGLVIDGKPFFGAHRNAGEFSSMFSPGEAHHRPALRYLIDRLRDNGIAVSGVEDMRRRFDPDWPGVEAWISDVMPMLDRLVNGLAGILDPQAIVFGGQIPPPLARLLIDRTRFYSNPRYGVRAPVPDLVVGLADEAAATLGAALLPLKRGFFR